MQPGEIQRWRFIHGGVQETLNVQLEGHTLHEIARDGLALGKMLDSNVVELEPGYRSDVLVKAEPGDAGKIFFLVDGATTGANSLLGGSEIPSVLAAVVVSGTPKPMNFPAGSSLAACIPLKTITETELTGKQRVEFDVDTSAHPARMLIDGNSYDPNARPRLLKLGAVEEWTVISKFANHPFHIHTNPFQVVSMKDSNGLETVAQPYWKDTPPY